MDSGQGVFVSNASTDEWTEDPDLPGTEMHELVHQDGVWVGLTRILVSDGPLPWTPEQRETVHVLEGSVKIKFENRRRSNSARATLPRFPPASP